MRTCSWLGILALLGAANHAAAADGDTYARVCVTNAQGIRVMLHPAGAPQPVELAARDAMYKARISGREALLMEFCDKNPVLFKYEVGPLKIIAREDVAAMDALASAIGEFGKLAAATTKGPGLMSFSKDGTLEQRDQCGRPAVRSINGIKPTDLQAKITELRNQYARIPVIIEATHDPRATVVSQQRSDLALALTKAPEIRALLKSLNDYVTARDADGPIAFELDRGDGSVLLGVMQGSEASVQDSCLREAMKPILAKLDRVASERHRLAEMLKALESLSTALQGVGETTTAATLHYDSKNDRQQSLTIEANPTFAEFFSSNTKQFAGDAKKVGKVTLQVEPQLDLRIEVAPGVIYSFVKQPKFSAEENDAGGFTITQTESNYSAASGIVAVNITRDKYSDENVRPFVQVGLWPKKDELAFVLGAGIALADASRAVLSFGAIYQERKKLAPGLAAGGALASADDLKTDTEFKVGFYVGVSYNMLPTK